MMTDHIKKKKFFLVCVFLLIPSFSFSSAVPEKRVPIAEKGTFDATDWNFSKSGPVELNGEWEFYWNQLIYPGDFTRPKDNPAMPEKMPVLTGYIKVPSIWNFNKVNELKLPFNGYATYRLNIKADDTADDRMGISIPRVHTSYNLYVNNAKIFSVGKVGKTKITSHPDFCPHIILLESENNSLDIVLQVASFHYPVGGIDYPIQFGPIKALTGKRENKLVFDIIIFGCIFIIFVYNLIFYFFNRNDIYLLFFSLLCFVVSFRALFTINVFFFRNILNINWELIRRIDYFMILLAPFFLYKYLHSLFPDIFGKRIVDFVVGISVVSLVVLLSTPILITVVYAKAYAVIIVFYFIYNFIVIIRACRDKKSGALYLLSAMIAFGATAINDIFYDYRLFKTLLLAHLGVLLFIIVQSVYIFQHISKRFQSKQCPITDSFEKKIRIINSYDLTNREKEILSLILEGNTTKDIAVKLDIAVKTVENHFFNIYRKTGLHSRFELLSRMHN
ncbi:MAG: hypothetical protein JW881_08810 [Spirochaetales bacterium]|nr:hypothetical protein [Spirochaetales bacterium]